MRSATAKLFPDDADNQRDVCAFNESVIWEGDSFDRGQTRRPDELVVVTTQH